MAPNRRVEPQRVSREVVCWLIVVLACVAYGLWLRTHALWRPTVYAFDEHHFVDNARNYLQGLPDENDHPPLGKLLIALGMKAFGDEGIGWRSVPALFGAASVAFAGLLARRLFPVGPAWALAVALVSLDGFAIAYSRVALLDGILCSLLLLCQVLLLGQSWRSLVGAAVVGGLALSIKFSGVCYLGPLVCALLLRDGPARLRWVLLAPALSLLVYYACTGFGLWLVHLPWGPASVGHYTLELVRHHAGLTDMLNPATSAWTTWFAPSRHLTLWRLVDDVGVRMVTTRGNALVWELSSLTVVALSLSVVWNGVGPVLRAPPEAGVSPASSAPAFRFGAITLPARSLLFALVSFWSCMAPWILTRRDSYLYHYLPSYLMALVLLAGVLGSLLRGSASRGQRRGVLALLLVLLGWSLWCSPRWAGLAWPGIG